MSRRSKQFFGTLVGACLVAGALLLPAAPAGAGRSKAGSNSRGSTSSPLAVTREGKGFDYKDIKPQLSKVRYSDNQIIRDKMKVPMDKGDLGACPEPDPEEPCDVSLHVEVVRPKNVKPYPTILELSPYHGTIANRSGTRIFPGPKKNPVPDYIDTQFYAPDDKAVGLAGYFAPRGYAVVFADLRGTGKSGGCLDHLGAKDRSDSKDLIQWIAKQKWSNGRVGMTGHSYVGSTPSLAASTGVKALKTIVPSAGLAAMYHHKFQHGVPYFLQWIGPAEAYEQLAIQRHLPGFLGAEYGDAFGTDLLNFVGCGLPNSAAVSADEFESGQYDDSEPIPWDVPRDSRDGARKADIPVFAVHGVNDNAARIPALDWFHARDGRKGDKAWIGQWDHGSNFFPNDRTCPEHVATVPCPNDQWTLALHAWFDKHLAKRDVPTGPDTELFLSDRKSVFQSSYWPPRPENRGTPFHLSPDTWGNGLMKLVPERIPAEDAAFASFVGAPTNPVVPLTEFDQTSELGENALGWESRAMKNDVILGGIPKLKLYLTMLDDAGTPPHVIGTLYDIAPNGDVVCVELLTGSQRCGISKATYAMNPELRGPPHVKRWNTPSERTPVIPGPPCPISEACPHKMELKTRGMAQAYLLEEGHRLRFVLATSQPDKVATRWEGEVTVYMGGDDRSKLGLPIVRNARVRNDPFYTSGGADGF